MTPSIGQDFVRWTPPTGGDETLGHCRFLDLSAPGSPGAAGEHHGRRRKWAAGMPRPAYAIDDETAIQVVDGAVKVVSEGHWKLFAP